MHAIRRVALLLIASLVVAGCALTGRGRHMDVTGTWRTEGPVPYLVEPSAGRPHGTPVGHEQIELVERTAQLEFELIERPDGIVHGMNRWVVYDERGGELHRGEEPLLGARDGGRTLLVEPEDEAGETAQLVFELSSAGGHRLRGIGYDVGAVRLIAMRFELVRVR